MAIMSTTVTFTGTFTPSPDFQKMLANMATEQRDKRDVGRWIDALPPGAKDRIIVAQNWNYAGHHGGYESDGPGLCLVDHALGDDTWLDHNGVATRFDRLCQRFGAERVIRACKMRAARGNEVLVPAPTHLYQACPNEGWAKRAASK